MKEKINLPTKITISRIIFATLLLLSIIVIYIVDEFVPFVYKANIQISSNGAYINYIMIILFVVFLVGSVTDYFDGHLARKYNLVTDLGKFLDPIADKMLVNSALIILSVVGPIRIPVICTVIMVARDIVVDAIRMNAVKKNKVIAANIFGKLKTVFQMVALIFVMINDFGLSDLLTLPNYLKIGQILIYLATAMSFISGVIYVYQNRDLFREMK